MTAAATRRSLLAATTAVVTGSGITAGAAASVADLVPVNPDAALIRLCDEYVSLELAYNACYDGMDHVSDDEMDARSAPIVARQGSVLDMMWAEQATTADGILARAKALAVHNGGFWHSFDYAETWTGRQLKALLRDAAAIGGAV